MEAILSNRSACTMMSINVQSLNAHASDIATDHVLNAVDLLALSETWMDDGTSVAIAGYDCIVQQKRHATRAGGVAIYQKIGASEIAVAHDIQQLSASRDALVGAADQYGDICAVETSIMGTRALLFALYLSPDTTLKQKKCFFARNLLSYHYFRSPMPIVVTGDFNIDVSKSENNELIAFMSQYLQLELATDRAQATTLGGTCLDLTFHRNIQVECTRYISYFSYHRPMLSVLSMPDDCVKKNDASSSTTRSVPKSSSSQPPKQPSTLSTSRVDFPVHHTT
ncbi:uncharacterized protein LOC135707420 [Ochlerotatus camptorhynchus]|uniref:uncharacterized protein LOC135707420 n=1 Tax=Ochlerotatus camptorhynchus TaxID=644619 RepID=UPI0031E47318